MAKPNLVPKIRGTIKKVEEFVNVIYQIVYLGQAKSDVLKVNKTDFELKAAVIKQLTNFGIQTYLKSVKRRNSR